MAQRPNLELKAKTDQRLAVLGRLRMAKWMEMREPEFASEIETLEKDPLFRKLFFGSTGSPGVIRRQRWPAGGLSSGFYELNEATAAGGEPVEVEQKLEGREALLAAIRKMGRPAFERYYLYAEEALPLEDIARRTGLTPEEAGAVHELLLEIGAQAEFAAPSAEPSRAYSCLAELSVEGETPSFQFLSPYWARGLYQIRYDRLEQWKTGRLLAGPELRRLRSLLKRVETINLRQNTLYRIVENLASLQGDYLRTRRLDLKRPISLRMLARRLSLAPSTISRAASGRSIRLPWGKEAPLIELLPGRRRVLREALSRWHEAGVTGTDAELAERLKREYGIKVSRRTVNAARHQVEDAE